MKQYEAVIEVMEQNRGFATLGFLNQEVLKVPNIEWKTKTPFASIRRIVQDERFFFKIKPGLWALKSFKDQLPFDASLTPKLSESKQEEFNHTYYQGLIVEVGNLKRYQTFIPKYDKNKDFLGKKLGDIATIKEFYKFSYDNVINKAQTIDVSWFNSRKMPSMLFEVEHSTDIQNSLLKFIELQDFNTQMYIVADEVRQREFQAKLYLSAFQPIQKQVKFLSYDKLSDWHAKTFQFVSLENNLNVI